MKTLLPFIFLSLLSTTLQAQNEEIPPSEYLIEFTKEHPREKIYVTTDRDNYIIGEDIWFGVHLVSAMSHMPRKISKVVYVELIDPFSNELVSARNIEIIDGFGKGDFQLNTDLPIGKYKLRAYTKYMQNFEEEYFFSKDLNILASQQTQRTKKTSKKEREPSVQPLQMQFFPEGGNIVVGLQSKIAFKAVDADGTPVEVEGFIANKTGSKVSTLSSQFLGMGVFILTAQEDQQYTAKVKYNGTLYNFEIPQSLPVGSSIYVQQSKNLLFINLKSTLKGLKNHRVVGQIRGRPIFDIKIDKDSLEFSHASSTQNYPEGILHVTHFNEFGQPLNEVLTFILHENEQTNAQILMDEKYYSTEEKVELDLNVVDVNGDVLEGNYSLKIVDQRFKKSGMMNIKSYLLLESDLQGKIYNPDYYFDEQNPVAKRKYGLDLIMRTHGWRRFTWGKVFENEPDGFLFQPELEGFNIPLEVVIPGYTDKPYPAKVSLSVLNPLTVVEGRAQEDGRLEFLGLDIRDTTAVFLKANKSNSYKIKKNKVKSIDDYLMIRDLTESPRIKPSKKSSEFRLEEKAAKEIADAIDTDARLRQAYFDVLIEPILIKAKAEIDRRFRRSEMIYSSPSNRITSDEIGSFVGVFDMLRRVPGVNVIGSGFNASVSIRGRGSISGTQTPLYLYDGIPVDQEFISSLTSNDIDFIDVLKGATASIYGSRGSAGVIALYTKKGTENNSKSISQGKLSISMPGYYRAREYYNPMFVEDEFQQALYSPTLFWEPSMKESIEFLTPDFPSTYEVTVEGITKTGKPILTTEVFQVE